ncbi:helix-turn-helix domain-containing protein [Actinomadura barringtoniae]|uniref:Helix-turn-helix domain-containing protein n=1 Tax=Actinomadura barringtoniae TaxID=1427535 RepID=A0A939PN65_9ACTN|nr:helix-turn-helix domain-containing protein [Actinomadura barringtoniae]MBO2455730.1 helix-turn-helix domain-containing protein [Actinomadura barringtoniae]
MTQTLDHGAVEEPVLPVPRGLASFMRPELPSLTEEIISDIRRGVPEYARPIDGPYGQALRASVEMHLGAFVDQIAEPGEVHEAHEEAARRLGQLEAHEGRSLDCLQAAFRISGQTAWRRIMNVAPHYEVSPTVLSRLADAVFDYMDRLVALALDGYVEAKESPVAILDERRRRLLRLILEGPSVPRAAIRELAEAAMWKLPDEVVLVATQPKARHVAAALDGDVLVDFEGASPHLLMPGPLTTGRLAMLKAAIPDHRVAVGLSVPLGRAVDSLRWARQALALAARGVLDDGPLTLCEDHLVTLWLLSDVQLIEQLARRQLSAMDDLTPAQRERLTETLRTWLVTRGTAAEIADLLHVHPQTVRYRMRQLERTFGHRLQDPETRFGIEVVLRAMHLRRRAGT